MRQLCANLQKSHEMTFGDEVVQLPNRGSRRAEDQALGAADRFHHQLLFMRST